MTRTITAAALQLMAHDVDDFSATWPQVLEEIRRAASGGAHLIVLPEGTVPAYVLGGTAYDEDVIRAAQGDVRDLAREFGIVIVYGTVRRRALSPLLENIAVTVGPDGELGITAKRFLWHFDRKWFHPGATLDPVPTPFGRIGVVVCADGRLPTIARTLVDRGAELLVVVTAWVSSGRDPDILENLQADLLLRTRAWENGVPVVAANKAGAERGAVLYCGKSQILDARGEIVALASMHVPQTLVADIELGGERPRRALALPAAERPLPLDTAPYRVAVTADLDDALLSVAAWSDVDLILCDRSSVTAVPTAPPAVLTFAESPSSARPGFAVADDLTLSDPASLVALRRNGHTGVIWRCAWDDEPLRIRLARTRAVELRVYVIVVTPERIAVVDPDGQIVAGTTHVYRMAQFVFDPARVAATTLVPGTDVLEGLEHLRAAENAADGAA